MQDVIDHSDIQNSFKVLMTSITKSESESCMSRVKSKSKGVGLESESNKIGTRVRPESKDLSPHLWAAIQPMINVEKGR